MTFFSCMICCDHHVAHQSSHLKDKISGLALRFESYAIVRGSACAIILLRSRRSRILAPRYQLHTLSGGRTTSKQSVSLTYIASVRSTQTTCPCRSEGLCFIRRKHLADQIRPHPTLHTRLSLIFREIFEAQVARHDEHIRTASESTGSVRRLYHIQLGRRNPVFSSAICIYRNRKCQYSPDISAKATPLELFDDLYLLAGGRISVLLLVSPCDSTGMADIRPLDLFW